MKRTEQTKNTAFRKYKNYKIGKWTVKRYIPLTQSFLIPLGLLFGQKENLQNLHFVLTLYKNLSFINNKLFIKVLQFYVRTCFQRYFGVFSKRTHL